MNIIKFSKRFCTKNKQKIQFSNSNIVDMKLLKESRVSTLHFKDINCPLFFQTIWSSFSHLTLFKKDHISKTELSKYQLDFSNYNDESYLIFQDQSQFIENNDSNLIKISENQSVNKIETHSLVDKDYAIISRIPQEISLQIETSKNIVINNTGDSKLQGNINVQFKNNDNLMNILEAKRVKSDEFSIDANIGLALIIKSSLETQFLKINSLDFAMIKMKKLGLTNISYIKAKILEIDIRAIYNTSKEELLIELENGEINIGTYQGSLNIRTQNAKIIIDEFSGEKLNINSDSSEIKVFISTIHQECNINNINGNVDIFLNEEFYEKFLVNSDRNYKKDSKDDKMVINVFTEKNLNIKKVSSWEYMKEKIERKFLNKKIESS